jgi:acyl-CoA synthetase (AMP-forming)/AMP-acid ligase II
VNTAQILWDAADATPDRVALRDGDGDWTYRALTSRASAIAEALVARGIKRGDRVAILLPHGAGAAAAFYGAAAAGATATLLNWLYRPRQVEYVLEHCGARVLLMDREWLAQQGRSLAEAEDALFVEDIACDGRMRPVAASGEERAQINYTSGSTGPPRGVVMTHDNLIAGIRTVVDYLGIRRDDRIASVLPLSFVYGFNQLNCAIATGAMLDIITSPLAQDIVRAVCEKESTVLAGVPPLWMQLLGVADFSRPIPSLRVLTSAGGRLSPGGVRALRAAQPHAQLFIMYGLTEVFRSTFLPPDEVDAHPDSMGRAVPGSAVYVVREDGTICADGEVGELVHAGPTVAQGYWQNPDATAGTFRPNPTADVHRPELARAVFSGDFVRRDAEGLLYYVGRRDRLIKTLGFRVSPDEIGDVILASKQVVEVVVTSEPDERRGERIVAHVVLRPEGTVGALRRWCAVELPRHMQPARWDVRDSIPRNANGKYDVLALKARVGAE